MIIPNGQKHYKKRIAVAIRRPIVQLRPIGLGLWDVTYGRAAELNRRQCRVWISHDRRDHTADLLFID